LLFKVFENEYKYLAPKSDAPLLTFGGDLLRIGEKQNFAEADLLWLSRDVFAIAECKCRYNRLDDMEDIRASLNKNLETAKQIGAQVVFLGVYTNLENYDSLFDLIQSFSEYSTENNVALHLIVNSNLYLWGDKEQKVKQIFNMANVELLLEYRDYFQRFNSFKSNQPYFLTDINSPQDCVPMPYPEVVIGERPRSYGGNMGAGNPYNIETLSEWEAAFLVS